MEITAQLREFAERYTAAWCSQNAASVAACYAENGSLRINDGSPAAGRMAIAEAAQEFMTDLPDLKVYLDGLAATGDKIEYRWTLTGTGAGKDGVRRPVRISGFEEWRIGPHGLIAESQGHMDSAEYQRQLDGAG